MFDATYLVDVWSTVKLTQFNKMPGDEPDDK
jgi:hypothetical protein